MDTVRLRSLNPFCIGTYYIQYIDGWDEGRGGG